jgi:hypothetical protein
MKKFIILTLIFLNACSSDRVLVKPQLSDGQTVTYERGKSKLRSKSSLKPELIVMDYSYDEMIIGVTISNSTSEAITFSEKNVEVELLSEDEPEAVTVYSFEQLAEEAAERGGDTAKQVGGTAASIGAGFIPFGSIAYSVGRLFYSLGSSTGGHEKRIDSLTFSQLSQVYLRQQTVEPDSDYSGILKIGFEDELEEGDTIIFKVSSGDTIEKFKFICEEKLSTD